MTEQYQVGVIDSEQSLFWSNIVGKVRKTCDRTSATVSVIRERRLSHSHAYEHSLVLCSSKRFSPRISSKR